jgi:hypothetical protein
MDTPVGGTSEALLAAAAVHTASAPRVAQMLYQHPEPGPTWQQSAQRAARLEPDGGSSKQGLLEHHERHTWVTWQQSAQRAAAARLEPGRR